MCEYTKMHKQPIVPTHLLVSYNNIKKYLLTPTFKATLSFLSSKLQHKQLSNKIRFPDIWNQQLRLKPAGFAFKAQAIFANINVFISDKWLLKLLTKLFYCCFIRPSNKAVNPGREHNKLLLVRILNNSSLLRTCPCPDFEFWCPVGSFFKRMISNTP